MSPRKDYWYAFLNWERDDRRGWGESNQTGEGLYYLEASLKYKKAGKLTIKKIFSWLDDLRCTPNINMEKAKEVHDNIIMSAFGIKSKYMSDFEIKINSFKELHIDNV